MLIISVSWCSIPAELSLRRSDVAKAFSLSFSLCHSSEDGMLGADLWHHSPEKCCPQLPSVLQRPWWQCLAVC